MTATGCLPIASAVSCFESLSPVAYSYLVGDKYNMCTFVYLTLALNI